MQPELALLSSDEALAAADQLHAVYFAAFSQPPYTETEDVAAAFARGQLPRHAARQGFRCVVARLPDQPAAVIGFGYGYTSQAGQWWHDHVATHMDDAMARRWLDGAFELVDLAVVPEAQGQGIGGRLHDALLMGLPQRTAVLSTRDADTRAMRLYRRRGWIVLLTGQILPAQNSPIAILGLDLTA